MPDPLRWFREWRSPRLICERTGEHAWRTATRRGYRYSGTGYDSVADGVVEERRNCCRCGEVEGDWQEVHSYGIQELSLPRERMERLERYGELWNA